MECACAGDLLPYVPFTIFTATGNVVKVVYYIIVTAHYWLNEGHSHTVAIAIARRMAVLKSTLLLNLSVMIIFGKLGKYQKLCA